MNPYLALLLGLHENRSKTNVYIVSEESKRVYVCVVAPTTEGALQHY